MSYQKSELYFLFAIIGVVVVLSFFIFQPFLYALILSVIFATVFAPIHRKFLALTHERRGVAALLTTVSVLLIIVVPIAFLSVQIFKEATQLYASILNSGGTSWGSQVVKVFVQNLNLPFLQVNTIDFNQYLTEALNWLIQHFGTIFSNIAKIVVGLFVLLVAFYYVLKEGDNLKMTIITLSPLQNIYDETVLRKLETAVNSVVRGSISVGLTQGVLTAIGLMIFGVPNAVLWGSVAAVAALIPGFGTLLVIGPAILFLFYTGATVPAFGLMVWGAIAVGLVDNVLGPKLVGKGVQLHPFLILLSVLGGISFFGPLGLLFGPLVLSLLFAFLEIYSMIRGSERSS